MPIQKKLMTCFLVLLSLSGLGQVAAFAQAPAQQTTTTTIATANQFNEVFMTAGYSAAFGAATAAALLVFFPNPEQNLKFVLGGASAGFVAGGLYSMYRLNNQYSDPQNNYPAEGDFGPLPPTQPRVSQNFHHKEAAPRGALFNAGVRSMNFDFPRFALAPQGVAIHVLQVRY